MNPPRLIPTRIVNKNGVLTTVHKSPARTSEALHSIPAPSPPHEPLDDYLDRLRAILNEAFRPVPDRINKTEIACRLRALPDETKQLIIDSSAASKTKIFDRMVVSLLHMDRSPETIHDVIHVFNNSRDWTSLVMNTEWSEDGFDVDYGIISKFDWARTYNRRLHGFAFRMEEGDETPLLEHDVKTQTQVIALIDITGYLAETGDHTLSQMLVTENDMLLLRDTDFAQLVVDYAERYDELMSLMETRGTTDAGLLRSILTADAQPLREGTL